MNHKLSKSDGPQGPLDAPVVKQSNHFQLGEKVKRAHTAAETVIGIFVYDDGVTLLTIRADDGSVSRIVPVALNR